MATRPHTPIPGALPPLALAPNGRRAAEAAIEQLILLLDHLDGDPDLEDDDPGGDPLDIGEDDCCDHAVKLRYCNDQAAGPSNRSLAYLRELSPGAWMPS